MPQSLSQIHIHLVFSTKNRHSFIHDVIGPELYAYMAAVLHDECQSPAKIIGGMPDHIHILFNLSRTHTISGVVQSVKTSTSKWIKTKDPTLRDFAWQTGYGAFSVSRSNIVAVADYISNQKAHHAASDFQNEFRGLLRKHEVEYDENYVWD